MTRLLCWLVTKELPASQDKFKITKATSSAHVLPWSLSYPLKTKKINFHSTKSKSKSKTAIWLQSKKWFKKTVTLSAPSTSPDKPKITTSKHLKKEFNKIQYIKVQTSHQWVRVNILWIQLHHFKNRMVMGRIISIILPTISFRWISKRAGINWRELRRNNFRLWITKIMELQQ